MARGTKRSRSGKSMKRSMKKIRRRAAKRSAVGSVHTFKGTVRVQNIVRTLAHSIADPQILGGQLSFSADQITNWTQLKDVFDMYRIKSVICKFLPNSTGFQNTAVYNSATGQVQLATADVGQFMTAIDLNSNSAYAGSVSQMLQYENARITPGNKVQVVKLRPKPAQEVYRSALTTGYGTLTGKNMWLNTDTGDIPHYGVLYCATPAGASNQPINAGQAPYNLAFCEYDCYITYEIEFKNVK